MSHEPAPQRPLHRQAGLHRVVAGETVLYLHLAKIDAVRASPQTADHGH